ncbi:PREDICTED: glucagon receptor isoform X1 [Ceratotherium simum simum]|uniref:Glucagon receptor isoform X1 n=1 Tax=Ceratotherium simum simum TaxID=73337 RepID=A0ABM1CZ67_CERSS|nr:PREDICTED: glucagon receptor isoform X1 [Ceratotherium simum simum]
MPPTWPRCPHLLLLLLLACQPQAPSAQVMDFLFEKWKLYGDQCLHNLSLLPPPSELVCNRTFDKYSCWPDTPPNTTANISCPWYLPWYHKVQHRLVFKRCGPDGQWVRGPQGQPWRNASQCQMDDEEIEVQREVAKMYSSFQVMYTVGYSLSLGALLLALAILLGLSKLHCTRNYIHVNLFVSFVLKASSVLVIDTLLETRYSQKIGDDLSVSIWLSDEAVAGCRVAAVFMQYGIMANYCWLLVEGVYLHSLLGLATFPERSFFALYLGIGWGAPMLFVIPWAVVKCLFENIQCWTSNDNMGFWWILRFPVFLAILINFFIFLRIVHILVAKLRAHQMRYTDYKLRACWWLFFTVSSTRRCSRSCCGAGIAGAQARHCRRSATSAATRAQPGPPVAPPARSCCSPGVAAATGPARTPLQRPAWPAASLGWLSAPSEAPGAPAGAGLRHQERASLDNPEPDARWKLPGWEPDSSPIIHVSPRVVV